VKIFGQHDEATVTQLQNCLAAEPEAIGVLCADGHLGYSMPIGGVVAYKDHVSPSGVGYDIACGNMAVKTNLHASEVEKDYESIADAIQAQISFGMGRSNNEKVDDPVLIDIATSPVPQQRQLAKLAQEQLGTVGSGNHYVDVLEDQKGYLWVACHFGSRGFGHKTATMFMNVAKGLSIDAKSHEGEIMAPPLLLPLTAPSGQDYLSAMQIAGNYAYAGRRYVVNKVLSILGATAVDSIHNHHNFTWREEHRGEIYHVVRKGSTPAEPGQRGFIGGSMGDISVIAHGKVSDEAKEALYSTVHGAGRLLSRRKAAGKEKFAWKCLDYRKCDGWATGERNSDGSGPKCPKCGHKTKKGWVQVAPGVVDFAKVRETVSQRGTILRGAGADEAPECYRPLRDVLAFHEDTIDIEHVLQPRIVVMAGKDTFDPYKD
jgi:tRNA-splicing ligase RtcB (3'-phosphate/5'-hydroxy nucleic acid ligase)